MLKDEVPVHRLVLEKVRLSVGQILPNEVDAKFYRDPTQLADNVRAHFQTYIAGMGGETVRIEKQWPRDWWQAFRERWLPKWWLAKHPVQYERIDFQRRFFEKVCPHFKFPDRPGEERHCLQFFTGLNYWEESS